MAFTQADAEHLEGMIASGILESETGDGKRVKFASMYDLRKRYAFVLRALRGTHKDGVGYYSPESD